MVSFIMYGVDWRHCRSALQQCVVAADFCVPANKPVPGLVRPSLPQHVNTVSARDACSTDGLFS